MTGASATIGDGLPIPVTIAHGPRRSMGGAFGAGTIGESIDPMFISLFVCIVIGGFGVLVALSGGARLWRHFHQEDAAES